MTFRHPADTGQIEWIGQILRRGDRWWIAPPRTPLPNPDEEPEAPWVEITPTLAPAPEPAAPATELTHDQWFSGDGR